MVDDEEVQEHELETLEVVDDDLLDRFDIHLMILNLLMVVMVEHNLLLEQVLLVKFQTMLDESEHYNDEVVEQTVMVEHEDDDIGEEVDEDIQNQIQWVEDDEEADILIPLMFLIEH